MLVLTLGHGDVTVLEKNGVYVQLSAVLATVGADKAKFAIQGPEGLTFLREELPHDEPLGTEPDGHIGTLVVSRKVNEAVVLSNWGRVVLLKRTGSRVRVGFELDREVEAARENVWLETHASLPYALPGF